MNWFKPPSPLFPAPSLIRLGVMLLLLSASRLPAAVTPYIGYVFPAGGQAGAELEITLGGQHVKEFAELYISGLSVTAEQTGYARIYEQREKGRVRRQIEVLEARREEAENPADRAYIDQALERMEEERDMIREQQREERRNPVMTRRRQFNPQIAERLTLRLQLPSNAAPGHYELRVITPDGLSNPLVFLIGDIPEIQEQEPNDRLDAPQPAGPIPLLVNGQIMPGDEDCFQFEAQAGQTLLLQADARALIPYLADAVPGWFQAVLTLYDAQGREIAANDDFYFQPDPALLFTVPETGTYTVRIHDSIYRGREDFIYRLSVRAVPASTRPEELLKERSAHLTMLPPLLQEIELLLLDEREENNTPGQAQPVEGSRLIRGAVDQPGDVDCFRFEGRKGEMKTLELFARRLGAPLDGRLMLFDENHRLLAVSDDVRDDRYGLLTHHADPKIELTLPTHGTYYVRLDDVQRKGGPEYAYRLLLSDPQPDFELRITPSALKIPRDGSAAATLHLFRSGGFTAPVALALVNPPAGLTLEPAEIPEGADSAQILIRASNRAAEELVPLIVEGRAKIGLRDKVRHAVPAEDRMQAFLWRHLVPARELLARISPPEPVTLAIQHKLGKIRTAVPGETLTLPVQIQRREGARGPIKLRLTDPPEWLTLGKAQLTGHQDRILLKISPNAEPGAQTVTVLRGTLRVPRHKDDPEYNPMIKALNFTEHAFAIDAIALEIIDPEERAP